MMARTPWNSRWNCVALLWPMALATRSVSRGEFKRVFFGGQRIKFIEPVESESEDENTPDKEQADDNLL